jgi:hypothetical protein
MATKEMLIERERFTRRCERSIASAFARSARFEEAKTDAERLPTSFEIRTENLILDELLQGMQARIVFERSSSSKALQREALRSLTSIETQPTAADEAALIEEMARRT